MNNSEAFRAAVRACAKVILGNDTSPYEPALEILGLASGGHPVDDGDEADTGLVSIFGELTDWAELRPEEADQAGAHMVTAAREWLAVEGDQEAEAHYFNRWQYDIVGFESADRRTAIDLESRRRRAVPLPALCIAPLRWHRMRQAAARAKAGEQWQESGYVFTTRTGRQVEPRNVYRSFTRVAELAGLRVIRLHDARHGTATLLTAAGVAPRVVMEILGHSQISITMDVYTHIVQDTQREAMSHMDRLLRRRLGRQ